MTPHNTMAERWAAYRPSKGAVFWLCVAISIVTMVAGFGWGGWVTTGTANEMVKDGRQDLAAAFCVQRFLAEGDAESQHAALMAENSWKRQSYIEKGGWAGMPKLEKPISGVADLCAQKLADVEMPASSAQSESGEGDNTTVQ